MVASNIKVYLRIRPSAKPSKAFSVNHEESIVTFDVDKNLQVGQVNNAKTNHKFKFDGILSMKVTQEEVFNTVAKPVIDDVLQGINGTIFAYGQTGSGKTHTMFGPPGALGGEAGLAQDGQGGLVPQIAAEVLSGMQARRAAGFEVTLGASYVEVFGNDVSDLLGGALGTNRAANQRMAHRYVLTGQCEEPVNSSEDFAAMLARGEENKRQASTAMNERSTRAHVLVILRLRQRAPGQSEPLQSILSLVDLGGSERVSKSKANEGVKAPGGLKSGDEELARVSWQDYYAARERITETNHINKGLLTLKRCIAALNERQQCVKEGREPPRVPFHDCKLTMLLEPALDGDSRTSVVICCSPDDDHAEETVQSLRFGEMCSNVQQERRAGASDAGAAVAQALRQIDDELREVEAKIRTKERWEWRRTIRTDVIDEKNTGGTVCHHDEEMELGLKGAVEIMADDGTSKKETVEHEVLGQVLVGAEEENARREELLKQRRRILGQD
mmetsp:Transcript_91443/g.284448  ORF Transcript_91443/g.284448 Transcript_91443/m.284448 type:complete len:501 (-) Transcript_91443:48-1550(-)